MAEQENWIEDALEHWRKVYFVYFRSWDSIAAFTTQELADWIFARRVDTVGLLPGELEKDRAMAPITIARFMMAYAQKRQEKPDVNLGTCEDCALPSECCAECKSWYSIEEAEQQWDDYMSSIGESPSYEPGG